MQNEMKKIKGFSIAEVLISILVVSLVLVAMAPVITKKLLPKKTEGVVYTYSVNNHTTVDDVCFTTSIDYDGKYEDTYYETKDCSEYTFTVPDGVSYVDLTLVAGGGGGGGAAGGVYTVSSLSTDSSVSSVSKTYNPDILKSVVINLLTSKGDSGGDINDSNYCSDGKCGGKGGDSSAAIANLTIPYDIMRGADYANSLVPTGNESGNFSLDSGGDTDAAYVQTKAGTTVQYSVLKDAVSCKISTTEYGSSDTGFADICGITKDKLLESVAGEYGDSVASGTSVYVNTIFSGGLGGKLNILNSAYGAGGKGASAQVMNCDGGTYNLYCTASTASWTAVSEAEAGGDGNASITYTTERAGGTGGGGAGGSAVRILNFPVSAGETYTIRVGSGGKGGLNGVAGIEATGGSNGGGGVTTAIYNSKEDLIYMVNGGAGGQGGSVYSGSAYTGTIGLSGRNEPLVISSSEDYFNYAFDEDIATTEAAYDTPEFYNASSSKLSFNVKRLVYPYISDEPYATINNRKDESGNYSGSYLPKYTGGFSGFDIDSAETGSGGVYDGLYYRALSNGTALYAGGLGGFSGLGTKAGCGAYFVGNFDGRKSASGSDEDTAYLNTFISTDYSVFDYYDSCSLSGVNGKTAEFILPDPVVSSFGQAGSGGGGGGYSINKGSGRGGNGQDGYVMIEWRR